MCLVITSLTMKTDFIQMNFNCSLVFLYMVAVILQLL